MFERTLFMQLVCVTRQPTAKVRSEMLCKVAINLMNTCRVITKDMFTFSTETVWRMGAPDPLALPSFPLPVHRILLEMCTDVAGTASRGHFPPVSSKFTATRNKGRVSRERAESRRELGCYTMQTFMWLGENCVGVMGYDLSLNMWRVTKARAAPAEEWRVLVRIVTAKNHEQGGVLDPLIDFYSFSLLLYSLTQILP